MKNMLLIIAAVMLLAIGYFVYQANAQEDPLKDLKELNAKLADPNAASDSPVVDFNHVDPEADRLWKLGKDEMPENNEEAVKLFKQALDTYQGFKGFHYFEIMDWLSLAYSNLGNRDMYVYYSDKLLDGRVRLHRIEKGLPLEE